MNKRIRLLAEQAGVTFIAPSGMLSAYAAKAQEQELEKFAQLIVQECESVSIRNSHRDDDMGAIIARKIKQHFGVEL